MNPVRDLPQDFRYAARIIRKRPGFAAVAIVALALGIGANSAVFSVINAVLLRPMSFPDLDRLAAVRSIDPRRPWVALTVTPADYQDWRTRSRSFEKLAAYAFHDFELTAPGGDPEGLPGLQVTPDLLHMLGVQPAQGRDFNASEGEPGHGQVVILSDALWRNRFAADPAIVGRTIQLDSKPFLVIGVMPVGFEFPVSNVALWSPLALSSADWNNRRVRSVQVAGRLRHGVSLAQVRADMDIQTRRLAHEYPATNENMGASVVLLREWQGEFSKPFLTLLQGTALFVLLIACANLANLQLAHALARRREIAVRAALGAGRWRVIRLLLIESMIIALAGGVVAVGAAYWGVVLLRASVRPETTRNVMGWSQVALHPPVLVFTLVVAILCGIVFGLSAALQASRADLVGGLKDGSPQGGSKSRLRRLLVIGEVTLAVVAVTGASQMVEGFQAMFDLYQGFSPDRILALRLVLPVHRYDKPEKIAAFFDQVLGAAGSVPNVEAATVSSNLPGALRFNFAGEMHIEGRPSLTRAETPLVDVHFVGPDYFSSLSVPIRAGRAIAEQDGNTTPLVVVVSDRVARRYWPGGNPLGKRVRMEGVGSTEWRTIVGVVGDVHQFWFEKDSRPLIYLPYRQAPRRAMYLALRTRGDPMSVLPAVREGIHRLDATLPVLEPRLMRDLMQETLSAMGVTTGMMFVFGVLALLLAAVGVYGVMAYSVTHRNREFGIRMALGARPEAVLRMVIWQGLLLTVWGVAAGLAGGFGISRVMAGIMFGVNSTNPAVLAGVPALLVGVSLVACWIPARTVTNVDPARALRQD